MAQQPQSRLAARVLPKPLHRAVVELFAQGITGCMLVGGTALSGYYAGHRRSDDLDLFTQDDVAQRAAVLAIGALEEIDASIEVHQSSKQFYSAICSLHGHVFTAQVVLDSNLFVVGSSACADDGVVVAELATLLKQKAATIVSRCSEKDLYDLLWLLHNEPQLELSKLIALGAQIDAGLNAEAALISLVGAQLRQSACDFSLTQNAQAVFRDISTLRERLVEGFDELARNGPVPIIAELIGRLGRTE